MMMYYHMLHPHSGMEFDDPMENESSFNRRPATPSSQTRSDSGKPIPSRVPSALHIEENDAPEIATPEPHHVPTPARFGPGQGGEEMETLIAMHITDECMS